MARVTRWTYRCADGHGQGVFTNREEAMRARKDPDFRSSCGPGARLVIFATEIPNISPDIPEHFNVTIGQPVRSRRHLRELQKRHGWQDYEPDSAARKRHAPPDAKQLAAIHEAERLGAERSATVFKDDPEVSVLEPME